jgi:hypothetical protein
MRKHKHIQVRSEFHITSALNVPGLHFVHEPTMPCEMAYEHIQVCVCVCVCVCQGARQKTGRMNGHGLVDTFWQFFWYSNTHWFFAARARTTIFVEATPLPKACGKLWEAFHSAREATGTFPQWGFPHLKPPRSFKEARVFACAGYSQGMGSKPERSGRSRSFLIAAGSSLPIAFCALWEAVLCGYRDEIRPPPLRSGSETARFGNTLQITTGHTHNQTSRRRTGTHTPHNLPYTDTPQLSHSILKILVSRMKKDQRLQHEFPVGMRFMF